MYDANVVAELDSAQEHVNNNDMRWIHTIDAQVWGQKFMETMATQKWKKKHITEDLMVSWFACAIMSGYDEGTRRATKAGQESSGE